MILREACSKDNPSILTQPNFLIQLYEIWRPRPMVSRPTALMATSRVSMDKFLGSTLFLVESIVESSPVVSRLGGCRKLPGRRSWWRPSQFKNTKSLMLPAYLRQGVLSPFPGVPPGRIPSRAPCTSKSNSMFHINPLLPQLIVPFDGWRQSWPA